MENKLIYIDIDGVLCDTEGMNYKGAQPRWDALRKVQKLSAMGNVVILWTSRGVGSGLDFRGLTEEQLVSWGLVKGIDYHELRMDKPVFDLFVDDKAMSSDEYFK